MPLPAIAAVVARVAGSAAVRSAVTKAVTSPTAKAAGRAAVRHVASKALTPRQQGSAALSQHQFPDSPPWGGSTPSGPPPPW